MDPTDLILVAEDNVSEQTLMREALEHAGVRARIKMVSDGEQVLLYLQGLGSYANREHNPVPSLIILDLKMPRKGGLDVLQWLADNRGFGVVPTIVLTSSKVESDIRQAYGCGANTYFAKP